MVKSLGAVNLLYASSIDTEVQNEDRSTKDGTAEVLSQYRVQLIPVEMNFDFLRYDLDPTKFNQEPRTQGLLAWGIPSMYETG